MKQTRRSIWLATMVLLGTVGAASAQQVGSIRGKTFDADFDIPLAGAEVTIVELDVTVTSSDQGLYAFPEVPPGSYTLQFRKQGYEQKVISNVLVQEGQLTEKDVELGGEFTDMDEFIVQELQLEAGSEEALLDLRFDVPQMLDSIGEDFLSAAGAGDAEQGLKLVSGATTTDGGFAAVRGLPPRYVSTQLNGVVLPSADPEIRSVQLDLFPAEVIESIQVSKSFTPDQQGAASGGAVNIVTKSIPNENFIKFSSKVEFNTQRPGSGEFLIDGRGGLNYFGMDDGRTLESDLQRLFLPAELPRVLSPTEFGTPAIDGGGAPIQYEWGVTGGMREEFDNGVSIGGLFTFFWDQSITHDDERVNNDLVAKPGRFDLGLIPDIVDSNDADGFLESINPGGEQALTAQFEETQSKHEITWGGLATFGVANEDHALNFAFVRTMVTTSTNTIAEDTQSHFQKFPGHDPDQAATPGGEEDPNFGGDDTRAFAPFRRLETQEYLERSIQSIQFNGEHTIPLFKDEPGVDGLLQVLPPVFDWNVAFSESERNQPGTTIFDAKWLSARDFGAFGMVGQHSLINFPVNSLGPFNIVFRDIKEESTQFRMNLELPFRQWSDSEGFVKFGVFDDKTTRTYVQDTFALLNDSFGYIGPYNGVRLSQVFTNPDNFPLVIANPLNGVTGDRGDMFPSPIDFTYTGTQEINAWYWMVDLPLTEYFNLIGGFRYESTKMDTAIVPDDPDGEDTPVLIDAQELQDLGFLIGGSVSVAALEDAGVSLDAKIQQSDILPSIGFVLTPVDGVTVRGAYSETIARPTFRELSPGSQALFAGETPFVGNPFLTLSSVQNYDFRLDYRPQPGSLVSMSFFHKDVENVIQVIQQTQGPTSLILPVNLPKGEIEGWEVEIRQDMGLFFDRLEGLTLGGNATVLNTKVKLREYEKNQLRLAGAPQDDLPMVNAPDFLYNLYATYDSEPTGTQLSLFYTVRGDTLIVGPGIKGDIGTPVFFVPAIYETEFGTLNFRLTQMLGEYIKFTFSAKNLLDPEIQTVYRSEFIPGGDVVRTSESKGIDLSIGISATIPF